MKTGDIVKITGAYIKNDNGTFRIQHSPGDENWTGNYFSLIKLKKNGEESTAKYNLGSWPLAYFTNNRDMRIAAKKHDAEHAKIEIVAAC